jgi:hypothetical protein
MSVLSPAPEPCARRPIEAAGMKKAKAGMTFASFRKEAIPQRQPGYAVGRHGLFAQTRTALNAALRVALGRITALHFSDSAM